MKLLLIGATGLVGRHVLNMALADQRVGEVIVLGRRALQVQHPKLRELQVDFDDLPQDAETWRVDAVICALGTTMRAAGSRQAFERVDRLYPLFAAQRAREHGVSAYVLNSAAGANPRSFFFYNRVKGKLEEELRELGFASLSLVRPGLIGGERVDFRLGERVAARLLTLLGPLLPRSWRINPAPNIAKALLEAAIEKPPGIHIVRSKQLA
ncbi:NAD(P)H-binding protein [Brucella intermedia]|uniref:NAD(P)H-binding protein n=1 Tax=Brucella intermedia TaxID=94625 RepID=UPI00224A7711|nr:NAD(P)H-binding protein [Brucella intermedia]